MKRNRTFIALFILIISNASLLHANEELHPSSVVNQIINKAANIKSYVVEHVTIKKNKEPWIVKVYHRKTPYAVRKEYVLAGINAIEIINNQMLIEIIHQNKSVIVEKNQVPDIELENYLKKLKKYSIETIDYFNTVKKCLSFTNMGGLSPIYRTNKSIAFRIKYYIEIDTGLLLKIAYFNWYGGLIKEEFCKNYALNPSLDESLFQVKIPPDYKVIGAVSVVKQPDGFYYIEGKKVSTLSDFKK